MMRKSAMLAVVFLEIAALILSSCSKTGDAKPGLCGNGILDPGEKCDDGNLNTNEPNTGCYGSEFTYCRLDCRYKTESCDHYCGDGIIDVGEECEGNNLNGRQCADFVEFSGGILGCNPDCTFDTSGCTA
jgi:cysteine-rich repeat protein